MDKEDLEKEFVIGREGNQPFTIAETSKRVSRKHCVIKVKGDRYTIRDLGSSHGTSVLDVDTGEFQIVSADQEMEITPFSLVCLAEDTQEGCTFYPYTLVHPDDYRMAFDFMREKDEFFDSELQKLEQRISMQKKLVFALNLVVFLASFEYPGVNISQDTRMWMLRVVPLASTGFAAFYDASAAKNRIKEKRSHFHYCPNPECSKILTSKEVRRGICKCMKKKSKK